MKQRRNPLVDSCLILLTAAGIVLMSPVRVQSQTMPSQTMPSSTAQSPTAMPPDRDRDDDATRRQLASFDAFLDSHPEVAEQLRKDSSLVNKPEFIAAHPQLQEYLQQHPEIRQELS